MPLKFSGDAIENRDLAKFLLWALFWTGVVVWGLTMQGCAKKHDPRMNEVVDTNTAQLLYFDGDKAHRLQRVVKRGNCITADGLYDGCQDVLIWPIKFENLPYDVHCWDSIRSEKNAMLTITAQAPTYVVVQTTTLKEKSVSYEEIVCEAYDPKEIYPLPGEPTQ